MTQKEFIQRERIAITEMRQTIVRVLEDLVKTWQDRLDDLELRIEKEGLTNGKPTFILPVEDFKAEDAAPSLVGKPDRD